MAIREIAEMAARLADLERRVSGMVRHGTVAEVDPSGQRIRLDMGPAHGGEGQFLSPWIPYAQIAGDLRVHTPPSVGQQFTAVSPTGDVRQAVAMPLTFSDATPSPSGSGSENVVSFGDVTITLAGGGVDVVVGGVTFSITGGGVEITGGEVRHNGKNIGDTHTHTDPAGIAGSETSGPN